MRPAPILFACLFASQAALLTRSPVLPDMARDLGLPLAAVGQLGTAAGLAGTAAAVGITAAGPRLGVRGLLLCGLSLLASGSVAMAVAPAFAWLLVAQLALGVGVSAVLAGGIAAVPAWAPPERRPTVLAWAFVGQPAAWVLGMPVIGARRAPRLAPGVDRRAVRGESRRAGLAAVGGRRDGRLARAAPRAARAPGAGPPSGPGPPARCSGSWPGTACCSTPVALLHDSYGLAPGAIALPARRMRRRLLPGGVGRAAARRGTRAARWSAAACLAAAVLAAALGSCAARSC